MKLKQMSKAQLIFLLSLLIIPCIPFMSGLTLFWLAIFIGILAWGELKGY